MVGLKQIYVFGLRALHLLHKCNNMIPIQQFEQVRWCFFFHFYEPFTEDKVKLPVRFTFNSHFYCGRKKK